MSRLRTLSTVLFCALGSAACGGEAEPRPEWIVEVSTDAPVPQLGDRLLVETLDENGQLACEGCRRALGAGSVDDFPVSFSIVPNGQRLLLRTRLFRTAATGSDGLPNSEQLIEHVARLPETLGRRRVSVPLSLGCLGTPADLAAGQACSPKSARLAPIVELGESEALITGSSPLAETESCQQRAPDGMECIPGGVFLRGDAHAPVIQETTDANVEHLVRLKPYFLDADEMSVGEVRGLLGRAAVDGRPLARGLPNDPNSACTFVGEDNATNDEYPINCVSLSFAQQTCAALGKRLPTEAEWEFAAGNRDLETEFPWGSDPNLCQYAVVSRSLFTFLDLDVAVSFTTCVGVAGLDPLIGPVPRGEGLDVTRQGIRNLAGNLTELVADAFATYSGPCWGDAMPLDNPRCDESDVPDYPVSIRGSNWGGPFFAAPSTARNSFNAVPRGTIGLGFRCAKDAE